MKKLVAAFTVALVTSPLATFACGGGDCSGMELPPVETPAPGPVDQVVSALSDHAGLLAGCTLAAALGFALARQRKLIATKSAGQSFAGSTS
ncbi:hypothetical protein BH20VER3_BH20VER3_07370 [soil metagenome]